MTRRNIKDAPNKDDAILDSAINRNKVEKQTNVYLTLGFVVAALPTFLYIKVSGLEFSSPLTLIVSALVVAGTTYSLGEAYHKSFEARLTKLKAEYPDHQARGGKVEKRQALIQRAALAYSSFFNNTLFLLLVVFLHFYLLKNAETHIAYILGMFIPSAVLYWLAYENDKTVKRKAKKF